MSKLQDELLDAALPKLKQLGHRLRDDFLSRYGTYVNEEDRARLAELVEQANDLTARAIATKTEDEARQYEQAIKSTCRSVKTLKLKVEIVQDAKDASIIAEALDAVLETFKSVGATLVGIVVQGVAEGAVKSFSEGDGSDLFGGVKEFAGDLL